MILHQWYGCSITSPAMSNSQTQRKEIHKHLKKHKRKPNNLLKSNWKRRQQSHFRRRAAKKDEMFKWEKVQMTPREESSQITAKEFLQL